jgi:RNA polymerase sigma-70 factor (ECF subfamily)
MVARQPGVSPALPCEAIEVADPELGTVLDTSPATLADIYRQHFPFVWRMMRRLGVPDGHVEDAVQDVFIVVHRRLADFQGRSSVRSWLAGIVRRVAHDHRRLGNRKPALGQAQSDRAPDDLSADHPSPEETMINTEAVRILHELLDRLDDDKREVFILAELEQWSIAEIAEATGVKINTASSRLRLAREAFEEAARRMRARDGWRL